MNLLLALRDRVSSRVPDIVIGGDERAFPPVWTLNPDDASGGALCDSRRQRFSPLPRRARDAALRRAAHVEGARSRPYLLRWYVIPRNRLFNVYLHWILRSDDDRALHDHPWWNCSILLEGSYIEHTISAGGIHHRVERRAGDIVLRRARAAHRLEIEGRGAWTLFLTGPALRSWGFHCPKGWVHWKTFTDPADKGAVGRGCGEDS